MISIPPLARKEKLIIALEHFEGQEITAREILKWMSRKWQKTGFSSPKSLGLYLRRYRFDKDGAEYQICQENIDERKKIGLRKEW